jgi:hypothetical protein
MMDTIQGSGIIRRVQAVKELYEKWELYEKII